MSHIRISALILASLVAALPVAARQDAAALAQRAVQLQSAGDYPGAAEAWQSVVKQQPDSVAAHVNLGIVLVQLGRYDDAIAEYAAADKLMPGDPRIALNTALAYEKSGRISEAQKRFEALHQAAPDTDRITMLLADCRLRTGDNAGVITLLQPLADKNHDDLAVAYMLGMALLREQRIPEGQALLDRILSHGDTVEARFLLGNRMFAAGDYPAAVKQLASAIELNPHLPGLQSLYGQALLNTGDPEAALKAFANELAIDPNDFQANLGTGQILLVRKQYAGAAPVLHRALLVRPQSAEAKLSMAECLTDTRRFAEARPYAEAAAAAQPQSSEAHSTLAAVDAGLHLSKAAAHENDVAQTLRAANNQDPGPKPGQAAPDFTLQDSRTGKEVHLAAFRGHGPVVLIFGSYTCPSFRSSADTLKSLQRQYGQQVPFLLVYIREAHSTMQWQSTRNARADVALAPATNMDEKKNHAVLCSRKLHLPFPAVVDGMDGAVENAYHSWPSRAFVVGKDGHILYSTRLTELDFHPGEMAAALRRASGSTSVSQR